MWHSRTDCGAVVHLFREAGAASARSSPGGMDSSSAARLPADRNALLRRQAFFSCGFRHVAHFKQRVGRCFLPAEPDRGRAGCSKFKFKGQGVQNVISTRL